MAGFEFSRLDGESDEDWAAACKDMARILAKAWGMEHLLASGMETATADETEGLGPKGDSPTAESGDAQGIVHD